MSLLIRSVRGRVVVDRPAGEVYGFYADFRNVPRIVGDVTAVSDDGDGRSTWTVALPLGLHTSMRIVVEEAVPGRRLRYRTSGPGVLRAHWRLDFSPVGDGSRTEVAETLSGPIGPPFDRLLAAVGKHPQAEVDANLARLKALLDRPR